MKCTSRKGIAGIFCLCLVISCIFTGCGNLTYDMAYEADFNVSSFNVLSKADTRVAETFAANLCVVTGDVSNIDGSDENLRKATAAALFSLNDNRVIYAENANVERNPASLTKVMTALVALKYGSLDQKLTATNAVNISESGATLAGLKVGDSMTLDQALRIMLVYSANDVAMLVAEGVGGTVDHFIDMMNEEAHRLGATNTNFTNPHGLTSEKHLTTAYDMYLIFNEAIKYETFTEIIQMPSYQTTYSDSRGNPKEFNKQSSNGFHRGSYQAPSNVTVIGGKTGTTNAAGHCLMLLVRDVGGAPYIAIILGEPSTDVLYPAMIELLSEI